jgi:hypothetical protein
VSTTIVDMRKRGREKVGAVGGLDQGPIEETQKPPLGPLAAAVVGLGRREF